jgi:hypothetical protein
MDIMGPADGTNGFRAQGTQVKDKMVQYFPSVLLDALDGPYFWEIQHNSALLEYQWDQSIVMPCLGLLYKLENAKNWLFF